ncbi:MAG: SpoIID-domain sporulation protein [Candidatus Collierbacteria bacterium GW2011_GWD2_42_50]|nr:MAG: SpoIID-domain sporulation protein [Candidatus Collierbacteria bacterium GW2011_GWD2_42_50]
MKSIQSQISVAVTKLKITEANIKDRSEKVSTQYLILSVKIREMYMRLRSQPLWISLFSTMNMGEVRRELAYRQDSNEADKQMIVSLVSEIGKLEADKKALEKQKLQLAKLQADLDAQNAVFQKEIKEISTKIAVLSARQQAILAEKQGTFTTTVGDVPLADDVNARPDYNPGFSPAFAAFSFGAPHFKGLSQYGAFGRAKSGQNAETILHAYYGGVEIKKDYDTGKQISVSGYGRMDIETYVKRIYEVPNSWGDEGGFEALKAQAVAARSYALAWTDQGNGGAICTTQACQVYKNADKGGNWERAVNETKGWVLWSNGKPLKSWYASTSGGYQESYTDSYSGYTTPSLWDTPSGRGGWTSQAYEKVGGSPWFYKGWYKGTSGDTCGRSHPWLTGEEMADILNAWVVLKSGSDDRVSPVGSCWGGNPYSLSELKSKAGGSGYSSVTGVSVSYSDGGYTSNVHFETDRGGVDISGADFKKIFNLRAPGRISLKSGLFNIEKK